MKKKNICALILLLHQFWRSCLYCTVLWARKHLLINTCMASKNPILEPRPLYFRKLEKKNYLCSSHGNSFLFFNWRAKYVNRYLYIIFYRIWNYFCRNAPYNISREKWSSFVGNKRFFLVLTRFFLLLFKKCFNSLRWQKETAKLKKYPNKYTDS